jgi:2,4-dienoyl-CoA reductase (NADPH2)
MSRSASFDALLSPGRIGALELRNRILMTPMGSNLAEPDGRVGERIGRYYEARARGGAGLLVVGVGAVAWPAGACNPNQVAVSDDAFLPGLSRLCERVHAHGARIALQLQHASKVAVRDIAAGRPLLVPSPPARRPSDLADALTPEELAAFVGDLARPGARMHYQVMSAEDIAHTTERFAEAAERARRAGFDAVELHAGHGYLFSSFLSPASNRREDAWGGPLESRARFLLDTIRSVKRRAGADFPVWCRIDAVEYRIPGGIRFEDAQRTAQLVEAAGADAVHVSAYADPGSGVAFTEAPLVHRPCGYVRFAAGIKRRVRVPVIAVGRIEPEEADRIVREGSADFVAMGRKLLADPELPNKLAAGRRSDVRPCVYCYTCVGQIFLNAPVKCAVNPATGREAEFEIAPAAVRRRVLVVGGGPAGLEAARIAALRGHAVTLCERSRRLGGTLRLSELLEPTHAALVDWLEAQVRGLAIELRLGEEVSAERVAALAPDVTLLAVGARHPAPPIPGVALRHVWSGEDFRALLSGEDGGGAAKLSLAGRALVTAAHRLGATRDPARARRLTRAWMPLGERVLIAGGGLVGVELAAFLAERGRRVTLIEESAHFATEMALPRRWRALHELREAGVALVPRTRAVRIEPGAVWVEAETGPPRRLPADSVVLASRVEPAPELAEALRARGHEAHPIGDCHRVGLLEGALLDAARAALAI